MLNYKHKSNKGTGENIRNTKDETIKYQKIKISRGNHNNQERIKIFFT